MSRTRLVRLFRAATGVPTGATNEILAGGHVLRGGVDAPTLVPRMLRSTGARTSVMIGTPGIWGGRMAGYYTPLAG